MQDMTKMSKNPKFPRSREYGKWINTRCGRKAQKNTSQPQYVDCNSKYIHMITN
jgi:hypothetical protein